MRSHLSFALFLLLLLALPARGEDAPDRKAVDALPAYISVVQSGGFWRSGAQEGHYRIVVTSGGFEHIVSHLFIQWVAIEGGRGETKVVRTVSVKEFESGHASHIEPRVKFVHGRGLQVSLAITVRDGSREKRAMTVRSDGTYDLR